MSAIIPMTGLAFGRLIVINENGRSHKQIVWRCLCECGNTADVRGSFLRQGITKSCGCLSSETTVARNKVGLHGETANGKTSPEYTAYYAMLTRCYNPKDKKYRLYGKRGISVCPRWRKGENGIHPFLCFLADVGRRPGPNMSLDRYPNNDGNYE